MKFLAAMLIASFLAAGFSASAADVKKEPPIADSKQQVDDGKAIVVDVREKTEYDKGHLKAARNVPLSELEAGRIPADLPKDKTIYTHCREGARAKVASKILNDRGYDSVPMVESYQDLSKGGFEIAK